LTDDGSRQKNIVCCCCCNTRDVCWVRLSSKTQASLDEEPSEEVLIARSISGDRKAVEEEERDKTQTCNGICRSMKSIAWNAGNL
jgi:hypothetical protein